MSPLNSSQETLRIIRMELSPGVSAPIVSLETLLNMKRLADRPQDQIDITELQRLQ